MKSKIIVPLLLLLCLFLILIKIIIPIYTYSYIFPGNDPSITLEHIQSIIKSQTFNSETYTRPLLPYLAAILYLITGISTTDTLLIPAVLSIILGLFLTYYLSKVIITDKTIACLSGILFACAIALPQVNSIVYYSLAIQPLIFLLLIKYIQGELKSLAILLIFLVSLFSYSQLFLLYIIILSAIVFFPYLKALKNKDKNKINCFANFYLMILLAIAINYLILEFLSPPKFHGFNRYLWFNFGLRRSSIETIDYIYKIIYLYFYFIFNLYLIKWYYSYLPFFYDRIDSIYLKINQFLTKYEKKFSMISNFVCILLIIIIMLAFADFTQATAMIKKNSLPDTFLTSNLGILPILFENILDREIWRISFLNTIFFLFVGVFGLFFLMLRRKISLPIQRSIIFIPLLFLFIGIIPGINRAGLNNFSGVRGLIANYSFIVIASSFFIKYLISKLSKVSKLILLSSIILLSVYSSTLVIYDYSYNIFSTEKKYIQGLKWFENNKKNDNFIVMQIYPLGGSINNIPKNFDPFLVFESDEKNLFTYLYKYYFLSFFKSEMPFEVMEYINNNQLYYYNFVQFVELLKKYHIRYIIFAARYDHEQISYYVRPIAKLIYSNNQFFIMELTD